MTTKVKTSATNATNATTAVNKPKKKGPVPKPMPSIDIIMQLSSEGLNRQQIANMFWMSYETFKKRFQENPEYEMAYRRGKTLGIRDVANALYQNAIQEMSFPAQAFILRTQGKWNDRVEVKHTHEHNVRDDVDKLVNELNNAKKR